MCQRVRKFVPMPKFASVLAPIDFFCFALFKTRENFFQQILSCHSAFLLFYLQTKSIEGNLLSFHVLHAEDKQKDIHEY